MNEENLKQSILDKIKKEEVKMTPKQFFVMKWFTLFVTSVFFLVLAIYIFAYIVFLFVSNGLIYIPLFSRSGLINFVIEIPWTLVFLGLFSIFLFSITSKTFYKIYRKPFLTFFFTILAIIILSHLIFVETGAMNYLKEQAYKDHLQLVPDRLLEFRDSQTGDLFIGDVVSTTSDSVIIRDRKSNLLEIFVPKTQNLNDFLVGKLINAYGINTNGKIVAKSIEIVQ